MRRIGKGADASYGMSGEGLYILFCQHLCFHTKEMLEFTVVDLHISGSDDQDGMVLFLTVKRQGLGDAGRSCAYCLSGQLFSGAGLRKFFNVLLLPKGFKILFYRF